MDYVPLPNGLDNPIYVCLHLTSRSFWLLQLCPPSTFLFVTIIPLGRNSRSRSDLKVQRREIVVRISCLVMSGAGQRSYLKLWDRGKRGEPPWASGIVAPSICPKSFSIWKIEGALLHLF